MSIKNRRIALGHAIALALHEIGSANPKEVVATASIFDRFLTEGLTFEHAIPSVTLDNRLYHFANTSLFGLNLKPKHSKKIAAYIYDLQADGIAANLSVDYIIGQCPELFDCLNAKGALRLVEALQELALSFELDPLEAVLDTLSKHYAGNKVPDEDREAWATLFAAVNADPADECPHCAEMQDPEPESVLSHFLTSEGAAHLEAQGVTTFADLLASGPVVTVGLPEADKDYINHAMPIIMKKAGIAAPRMINDYANLPLTDFGDVSLEAVKALGEEGIKCLADVAANPEALTKLIAKLGSGNFTPIVRHLLTALKKEIAENSDATPDQKNDLVLKIEALGSMLAILNKVHDGRLRREAAIEELAANVKQSAEAAPGAEIHMHGVQGLHAVDTDELNNDAVNAALKALAEKNPDAVRNGGLIVDGQSPEGKALLDALKSAPNFRAKVRPVRLQTVDGQQGTIQDLLEGLFAGPRH